MDESDIFRDEYDHDRLVLVQPSGQHFKMYVPPRYENHYVLNEYEKLTSRLFSRLVLSSDVFLDIGAHSGFFSLLAASSNPEIKVISVEPTPASAEVLQKNIDLFGGSHFELHQVAVSDSSGSQLFNISKASDNCGFGRAVGTVKTRSY